MNTIRAKVRQTTTRQFEHCGHLMMLVRLPALIAEGRTQSQMGWCCNVCGTIVDLRTMGTRHSRLKETEPGQLECSPVGLQSPRQQVIRLMA